jgi:hypothetical protein
MKETMYKPKEVNIIKLKEYLKKIGESNTEPLKNIKNES